MNSNVKMVIVDTGGANLASLLFAWERLGIRAQVSTDPDRIARATHVILPGVGAAHYAMRSIQKNELFECLRALSQPILGICLGMQIFFDASEEVSENGLENKSTLTLESDFSSRKSLIPCLGLISGKIKKMLPRTGFPIPHMGWNAVRSVGESSVLLGNDCKTVKSEISNPYYYFVHSFALDQNHELETGVLRGVADYGAEVPAVIEKITKDKKIFGVQFHPERSGAAGSRLLERFASL